MRIPYFSPLIFALLASTSLVVNAAPAVSAQTSPAVIEAPTAADRVNKVNLNTADLPTLQRELFGIGAAKAKAIVDYRDSHGPFASVDELLEVKGIGKTLLERNRDKLEVN